MIERPPILTMWTSGSIRTTGDSRSEEHTSELQSRQYLVCRLLLEKKKQLCKRTYATDHHLHGFAFSNLCSIIITNTSNLSSNDTNLASLLLHTSATCLCFIHTLSS